KNDEITSSHQCWHVEPHAALQEVTWLGSPGSGDRSMLMQQLGTLRCGITLAPAVLPPEQPLLYPCRSLVGPSPGRVVLRGEVDKRNVRCLQARLGGIGDRKGTALILGPAGASSHERACFPKMISYRESGSADVGESCHPAPCAEDQRAGIVSTVSAAGAALHTVVLLLPCISQNGGCVEALAESWQWSHGIGVQSLLQDQLYGLQVFPSYPVTLTLINSLWTEEQFSPEHLEMFFCMGMSRLTAERRREEHVKGRSDPARVSWEMRTLLQLPATDPDPLPASFYSRWREMDIFRKCLTLTCPRHMNGLNHSLQYLFLCTVSTAGAACLVAGSSRHHMYIPEDPVRLLGLRCNLLGTSPGAALLFGFLSDVACGFSATGRFGTMLAISPWEPDTCRGSIHILVPWLKCRIPQSAQPVLAHPYCTFLCWADTVDISKDIQDSWMQSHEAGGLTLGTEELKFTFPVSHKEKGVGFFAQVMKINAMLLLEERRKAWHIDLGLETDFAWEEEDDRSLTLFALHSLWFQSRTPREEKGRKQSKITCFQFTAFGELKNIGCGKES
ncbi:hypothetical protein IHE44_0001262, partial [Lamprotornis superbus]